MHLGRLHAPDSRDKNYLLKSLITIQRPAFKQWALNWKGDQKDTPQCVGYSWHALLRAKPILQRDPIASFIYREAQKVDEWPGEEYEGTSVRAGAKVLQTQGQIKEYRWAFDIETVLNWIGTKGPVVLGTIWTNKMFTPDSKGVVSVGDINSIAGGHAYLAIGYDEKKKLVTFQNSWGRSWGLNGRFYMDYTDVDLLIKMDGEACTPVE